MSGDLTVALVWFYWWVCFVIVGVGCFALFGLGFGLVGCCVVVVCWLF